MMYMGNLGRQAKLESVVTGAEMDEVRHVARVLYAFQKCFTHVLEIKWVVLMIMKLRNDMSRLLFQIEHPSKRLPGKR